MATSDWLNKHYDQRKTDKISHFEMNDSYLKKPSDKIIVRNLSVTSNSGRDAWKRQREQPAFVSITVHLAKPFQSASAEDVVDGSTVHYGKLSKSLTSRIKELNQNWLPTVELATSLNEAVTSLADSGVVKATEIDIFYPKATLLGDGAGVKSCFYHPDSSRMVSSILYYINHVTIPCVIGVNDHERQQKQPVVVTVSMDGFDPDESSISVQSSLTEVCNTHSVTSHG